jgi:prepilin-type N-terminal cleavage/methylation domain-containing protein
MAPRLHKESSQMKNSRFSALRQQGFSMVEILVVVAIVGIFSLVTVPNFVAMYRSSAFKASMRQFSTVIRNARQISVTKNERIRLTYATGTSKNLYTLEEENTLGTLDTMTATKWKQIGITHNLDTGSYFDATSNFPANTGSGNQEIYFFNNGTMAKYDGTPVTQPANVIIRSTSNIAFDQYAVNVNNTGRVAVVGSRWK